MLINQRGNEQFGIMKNGFSIDILFAFIHIFGIVLTDTKDGYMIC
jgi:hypothetical protein